MAFSLQPFHRFLIIGGSDSGKTKLLLNLLKNQRPDIDKLYLFESKYQLLINVRKKAGIKKIKNTEVFIDY